MTFEDLPLDWGENPITHELMPDVVDLFVKDSDRVDGCLTLLLLADDQQLVQPITVECFEPEEDPEHAGSFLTSMRELAEDFGGTYVAVRGRTGPSVPTPDDEAWFAPVRRALGERLVGAFVASREQVFGMEYATSS